MSAEGDGSVFRRTNGGSLAGSIQAKAQEVAHEDFVRAKALLNDAARSGAYLYPIRGIIYLLSHRSLWKPFLSRLAPTLMLSAGVVTTMFLFTYLPQLAVLALVNGPLAVFSTVLLVLNESSTIVNIVSKNFMLQDALLDTFDGTLVARDCTNIVGEGRQLRPGSDPMARLGKVLKSPFSKFSKFTPKAIVRYFMYLPLNFIPVVGTVMFILLQGRARGKSVHDRYFQLKRWSSSQRAEWIKEHAAPYGAFGTVATLFEMVPFASIFFSFTNTVGAALWAADIERNKSDMTGGTAGLQHQQRDAAPRTD